MFSKDKKNSFYDKYNINNELTLQEEKKIDEIIKRNRK